MEIQQEPGDFPHPCLEMEEEKIKLKLNIAGEALLLSVPFSRQEATRRIENEVNLMFGTWRTRFPGKTDRELLAMIAFRYAERYSALVQEQEQTRERLETLGERIRELVEEGTVSS